MRHEVIVSCFFFSESSQSYPSQVSSNYGSGVDTTALRATGNVIHDERFGNEILARAGPSHQYQNPQYRTHESKSINARNQYFIFIFPR